MNWIRRVGIKGILDFFFRKRKTYKDYHADFCIQDRINRAKVLKNIIVDGSCPDCIGIMKDSWGCRWFRCDNCGKTIGYEEY